MTLRELVWMAEGRMRHDWNIAAASMALLANINRDPKKSQAFGPLDFHPMAERKDAKVGIEVLKSVFVDRRQAS